MDKILFFLLFFVSITAHCQDTIYLAKNGDHVLDKAKAYKYRIVIKNDSDDETYLEKTYDLDWNLRNES